MRELSKSKALIDHYLPLVSRTFALNIRRLAEDEYIAIGVAYLICRILDTLEDAPETTRKDAKNSNKNSSNKNKSKNENENEPPLPKTKALFSAKQKITALKDFAKRLRAWGDTETPQKSDKQSDKDTWSSWVDTLDIPTTHISDNPHEVELLEQTASVMAIYEELSDAHREAIYTPVMHMAEGMAEFIERYQEKELKILETEAELARYCGFVAGTVGEILTSIFTQTLDENNQTDRATYQALQERSAAFAYALQLVNILKDFPQDQKRGWVYIPRETLHRHGLNAQTFLAREDSSKCKAVQLDLLSQAEAALLEALKYTQTLPSSGQNHHRIFCWLPLIMAAQTTALLRKQSLIRGVPYQHKITRTQIFFDLFSARIIVRSNWLMEKILRKNFPPSQNNPQK